MKTFEGNIVDLVAKKIFAGVVFVEGGEILKIEPNSKSYPNYILPGFIDSHIHIESSLMPPSEFARAVIPNGTLATVSDCHEIANVLGFEGINYMQNNVKKSPLKVFFGVPSCVPATQFDSAGANFGVKETEQLLKRDDLTYMGEFMDLDGVRKDNPDTLKKLALARQYNKPIDGHLPGFKGDFAKKFITLGVSTDHETLTCDEAVFKIKNGMKVQIRDGSACKDFENLHSLIPIHYKDLMFCSDDLHPEDIVKGHMKLLVKRAVAFGYDPLKVLQIACLNPVKHYNLPVGLLQKGDAADFIVVNNLKEFEVQRAVIDGNVVFEEKKVCFKRAIPQIVNNFHIEPISQSDIQILAKTDRVLTIQLIRNQLVTDKKVVRTKVVNGLASADVDRDILKIVYLNRYRKSTPKVAFIKGFGFKRGALAESVSHDSHNIVAVGTNDFDLVKAINLVIEKKGGFAVVDGNKTEVLPLPIAGLMSNLEFEEIVKKQHKLSDFITSLGAKPKSSFMTLAFMTLLVIPHLKIGEGGLFDVEKNRFVDVFV